MWAELGTKLGVKGYLSEGRTGSEADLSLCGDVGLGCVGGFGVSEEGS